MWDSKRGSELSAARLEKFARCYSRVSVLCVLRQNENAVQHLQPSLRGRFSQE